MNGAFDREYGSADQHQPSLSFWKLSVVANHPEFCDLFSREEVFDAVRQSGGSRGARRFVSELYASPEGWGPSDSLLDAVAAVSPDAARRVEVFRASRRAVAAEHEHLSTKYRRAESEADVSDGNIGSVKRLR